MIARFSADDFRLERCVFVEKLRESRSMAVDKDQKVLKEDE